MDPSKHIEELEAKVRELTATVSKLLHERDARGKKTAEDATQGKAPEREDEEIILVKDMRRRLDRAIPHGDAAIEEHIGAIWLSRLAVVAWGALIATYAAYVFFFLEKPPGLAVSGEQYFWIANGFLSVCYLLFSVTCIIDAHRPGEHRRLAVPMAAVNSILFFILTGLAIRRQFPEDEWVFRAGFTLLLLAFSLLARTPRSRTNELFHLFLAKTIIMATLALHAGLSDAWFHAALGAECLCLAILYCGSAVRVFKAIEFALMALVFAWTLAMVKRGGQITLGAFEIPTNWFCAVSVAAAFTITAWVYEIFSPRTKQPPGQKRAPRSMVRALLGLRGPTMAMVHAAAAALILLTITIVERGDVAALPYILAAEGVLMAIMGIVFRTQAIEIACVLLLVAAHVCYHVFLRLPLEGFEQQPHYLLYTVLLALFTYLGAHAWEHYLARFHRAGLQDKWLDFEHHVVAALPYLAATFMLTTLIGRNLDALHVSPAQGALGMALLLVGSRTRYPGVKASGILAVGLGAASLCTGLYDTEAPLTQHPLFLVYFALFLGALAGAERLLYLLQRYEDSPSRIEDGLRTLLVGLAVVLGALGLYQWRPGDVLVLFLLAYALIIISLGAAFRESRYRWGAFFMFAIVTLRAFTWLPELSPPYQVLTFGASAFVLLVGACAYARRRRRAQSPAGGESGKETAPDV